VVNVSRLLKKKLGEILLEEGLLKEEQVKEALDRQKKTGELLGEVLVKLGYISERDICYAISRQFGLPYIDASKYHIKPDFQGILAPEVMHDKQFVLLDRIGKSILIAISGVIDNDLIADIEKKSGCQAFLYVSTATQIQTVLKKTYPVKPKPETPAKPK
jgi:hypothetical protein